MPRSFVPTDEQRRRVKMLASLGQRHEQIAMVVGIGSTTTLRKHFREELTRGPAEAMANVRKTLFQMATSGKHPAATMFWLKTRARWSEQGREPEPEDAPKPQCLVVQFVKPPRRSEDGEIIAEEPTEKKQEYEVITEEEFVTRRRERKASKEGSRGDTDEGSFAHAPRKRLSWTEVDERRSIDSG
jgi:hypothetical protein